MRGGRRLARGDQIALGVGQRDSRLARRLDVGVDRRLRLRRQEAVARRRGVQQVAEIAERRPRIRALALAQRELGHIELERGVLGQALHGEELLVEPARDLARAAVGDDGEADLPLLQVALGLALDEGEDDPDAGDDGEREGAPGSDDDAPRAPAGAFFLDAIVAHRRPRTAAAEV